MQKESENGVNKRLNQMLSEKEGKEEVGQEGHGSKYGGGRIKIRDKCCHNL